jgi:hypothetical protein
VLTITASGAGCFMCEMRPRANVTVHRAGGHYTNVSSAKSRSGVPQWQASCPHESRVPCPHVSHVPCSVPPRVSCLLCPHVSRVLMCPVSSCAPCPHVPVPYPHVSRVLCPVSSCVPCPHVSRVPYPKVSRAPTCLVSCVPMCPVSLSMALPTQQGPLPVTAVPLSAVTSRSLRPSGGSAHCSSCGHSKMRRGDWFECQYVTRDNSNSNSMQQSLTE